METFVLNANAEYDTSEDFDDVDTDNVPQLSQLRQCIVR